MSCSTNYLSAHVNTWVSLALDAYDQKNPEFLDAAIEVLNQFPLTQEQNAKIAAILKHVPSDTVTQPASLMKTQIVQVLTGETEAIVQPLLVEAQVEVQGQTSLYLLTNTLCQDVIQCLFNEFVCQGDLPSIASLSYVSTYYNQTVNKCWERFNLKQICPQGLSILDLKTMGFLGVEPRINHRAVLKAFFEIAPYIENNAGCTLLTLPKDLTLNQLMEIGAEAGITMAARPGCLEEHGDIKVGQAYVVLMTNGVFIKSRNKSVDEQKALVNGYGCELPTLQEYVVLYVYTSKIFKKCHGQSQWTYARSSTYLEGCPFVVRASDLDRISFNNCSDLDDRFNKEDCGAAGQRKF